MNRYLAIDFGCGEMKAMLAEVQESGLVNVIAVETTSSEGIRFGIIHDLSEVAYKINELVKKIANRAKIHPDEFDIIYSSIGQKGMMVVSCTVEQNTTGGGKINKDILKYMEFQATSKRISINSDVIQVVPVFYELDGRKVVDPLGQIGMKLKAKYNVIYVDSSLKSKLDGSFKQTRRSTRKVASISALSSACLGLDDVRNGCALINFGAGTTTLGIYDDSELKVLTVVPFGADHITKDIASLGISESDAEKLKTKVGSALKEMIVNPQNILVNGLEADSPKVKISTKFLATIIEARLKEIVGPILSEINTYPKLEGGVVITGNGSKLKNLLDLLEKETGICVRYGNHSDWLVEDEINNQYVDIKYSQLVGTILWAHDYALIEKEPILAQKDIKTKKSPLDKLKEKMERKIEDFFGNENSMIEVAVKNNIAETKDLN